MKPYGEKEKTELLEVTGLWTNEDKNGRFYLSGNFGGLRVLILPNKFKDDKANAPDFKMYVSKNEKKKGDK